MKTVLTLENDANYLGQVYQLE